jgi:hypothetical protein
MAVTVHEQSDDPSRVVVLDELRQRAIDIYGEERAAEATLLAALGLAANAVWRVSQESLDPSDIGP